MHITLRLASENGLDNTSLQHIAAEAGITKASLLYHFPSRQDLIEQLFAYCQELSSKQTITISFSGKAEQVLGRAMEHWHHLYTTVPLCWFYRIVESQKLTLPLAAVTSRSLDGMLESQSRILLETLNETGRLDIEEIDLAVAMFTATVKSFLSRGMVAQLQDMEDDDLQWEEERFIRRFCTLYQVPKTSL